jgi:DUF1009 family protein
MIALIAGTGALPAALVARLDRRPLICALAGFSPGLDVDIPFRIEHLGSFLQVLSDRGVTQICMAGAIQRPAIDPAQIDTATMPLVPRIQAAIAQGDDGALREVIAIFEDHGFAVKAAHDIAPDLLPSVGVLTTTQPSDRHVEDAGIGERAIVQMGAADIGQACVVHMGQVVAQEDIDGTDALLGRVNAMHGILFKAPKPNQDRRADLPVIGIQTAKGAAAAGLAGIVIEADGVMVLNLPELLETLDAFDMFLWVRPKGTP